jgi:hypothetical protein
VLGAEEPVGFAPTGDEKAGGGKSALLARSPSSRLGQGVAGGRTPGADAIDSARRAGLACGRRVADRSSIVVLVRCWSERC